MIKYMAVAVAVAVAVSGGGAVAVAGLTKRFFNHIQKDFLINVWGYIILQKIVSTVVSRKKNTRRPAPLIFNSRSRQYQRSCHSSEQPGRT